MACERLEHAGDRVTHARAGRRNDYRRFTTCARIPDSGGYGRALASAVNDFNTCVAAGIIERNRMPTGKREYGINPFFFETICYDSGSADLFGHICSTPFNWILHRN
ncbi:hypothetical protein SDC9_105229 [bioreactor metagenome]|uniref:Uncharacterized protein n=1 Tax=bioreactor metagenome TaxID=1076179 RepID=A0A645B026_9ZZZZ